MKSNIGFQTIKLEKLKKADWNYKEENDVLTCKLIENIKKNGQIENVIVREIEDEIYEVVNGNHRLDVFIALEIPDIFCYNLGKVDIRTAQRIAIETNETKFATDSVRLSLLIKDIIDEFDIDEIEKTMPFNKQELEDFINLSDMPVFEQPEDLMEDIGEKEEDKDVIQCPNCGHKWNKK